MYRVIPIVAALFLLTPRSARADAFDHYINPILAKVPQAKGVKQVLNLVTPCMTRPPVSSSGEKTRNGSHCEV